MDIRITVAATSKATFSILLPDASKHGMPTPAGTGFFVSSDGYFVTAAHVVCDDQGNPRNDINQVVLQKEGSHKEPGPLCTSVTLTDILSDLDLAILKVDFSNNSKKEWLKGLFGFPYLKISTRSLDLGEPVYSYGYPLSSAQLISQGPVMMGSTTLCPRLTSAVVSSTLEQTKIVMSSNDPLHYVIDKALNYGNSGGPIVSTETGHVHAVCSRFQPAPIQQHNIVDAQGQPAHIVIPSLYGIVVALNNNAMINKCHQYTIPTTNK